MATNFPTSLDSLTNPATSDQLNSPSHALQHTNANDAIEALEAKVGVDGSTVTTSHAYKIAQLESDIQNSAGDFIPLSVLGQPSGPAELDADGNLIVPENKIIIEGATADAHELTIQAPDVASDITVTLPNAAGTLALTSDITTAVNNLVNSAPNTLDTLNELATALGNDANFATTTATSIGNKVSKAGGDTITSSTASTVPLVLKGAASQTANLQQWQNSAGAVQASIASNGAIQAGTYNGVLVSLNYPGIVIDTTSADSTQVWLRNLSATSKSGRFVGIKARNGYADAVSGDDLVTLEGQQYVSSLGYTSGKIVISNDDSTPSLTSNPARITFHTTAIGSTTLTERMRISHSGNVLINGFTASTVGFTIKGAASQTANIFEWQNSSGAVVGFINSAGFLKSNYVYTSGLVDISDNGAYLSLNSNGNNGSSVIATNRNASQVPFAVKGFASQTADLQQWQNSAGTVVASINSVGGFRNTVDNVFGATFTPYLSVGAGYAFTSGTAVYILPSNTSTIGQIIRGRTSQTANLQEWQNSAGTALLNIDSTGNLDIGAGSSNIWKIKNQTSAVMEWQPSQGFMFLPYGASNRPVTIKGAASQSANLTEWQNSAGTVRSYIDKDGLFSNTYGAQLSTANVAGVAGVSLSVGGQSGAVANTVLKNSSGATYDFLQFQNSSGTVLSKIDSTGAMFTTTAAANTNTTQVATTAYVQTELADLVNSAPATLDTLKELSDALGADANFATTVTNNLALKAPLASPALTGTPTAPTAAVGTDSTQVATTAFVIDQIDASTQPGALYQTTAPTSPEIGQIWIDSDDNVTVFDSNIIRRQPFTATAGQTNFVTTVPFIDGFEQVYFNGLLLLKTTDYTTSGTNTVILGSAAAVNDIIEVVTITNLNSVNTYTQAETDALLAANTSVAPLSISANTNILAKKRYFVTSASALTLTLPASPALNDEIQILDASGNASTYNITVARNGRLINGNAGNLIIDNNGGWYTLVYTGATYGWKVG